MPNQDSSNPRPPSKVLLLGPPEGIRLRDTPKGPAWAVGKSGKFRAWTGPVEVTEEKLRIMAESYDPDLDRAPINFDHDGYGPALGWIASVFFEDGLLWAVPSELSEEAAEEIKAGRRRRVSMEIAKDHQLTGDWYLEGLALLGAAKPAIRGLPEIALTEDDRVVIQLSEEEPQADPSPGSSDPASESSPLEQEDLEDLVRLADRSGDPGLIRAVAEMKRSEIANFRQALQEIRLRAEALQRELGVEDLRTFEEREFDLAHGISDKRALELQRDHPWMQERAAHRSRGISDEKRRYLLRKFDLEFDSNERPWHDDPRTASLDERTREEREFDRAHGISDERVLELQAKKNLRLSR